MKTLYATRDFNDAGTEQSFKRGDDLTAEPAAGNYLAAGLASEEKPAPATDPIPAEQPVA